MSWFNQWNILRRLREVERVSNQNQVTIDAITEELKAEKADFDTFKTGQADAHAALQAQIDDLKQQLANAGAPVDLTKLQAAADDMKADLDAAGATPTP